MGGGWLKSEDKTFRNESIDGSGVVVYWVNGISVDGYNTAKHPNFGRH